VALKVQRNQKTGPIKKQPSRPRGVGVLTIREYEVATWMGRRCKPAEIAQRLGISWGTVMMHQNSIRKTLGGLTNAEIAELFEPDWAQIDGGGA
jgi:DNA-binding CsgD family transcriptional regulator